MAAGSPPADAVREQLARILASEIFSRSDRLTAFLTYIVEQTLDGHGASLKEHVLAMEVYGKDADFGAAARSDRARRCAAIARQAARGTTPSRRATPSSSPFPREAMRRSSRPMTTSLRQQLTPSLQR